jgi:hypothetical protein
VEIAMFPLVVKRQYLLSSYTTLGSWTQEQLPRHGSGSGYISEILGGRTTAACGRARAAGTLRVKWKTRGKNVALVMREELTMAMEKRATVELWNISIAASKIQNHVQKKVSQKREDGYMVYREDQE